MLYFAYIRNRNIKLYKYTNNLELFPNMISEMISELDLTNYISRLDLIYSNIYFYEINLDDKSIKCIDKTSNISIDEYEFDRRTDNKITFSDDYKFFDFSTNVDPTTGYYFYEDIILEEISNILNIDLDMSINLTKFKWYPDTIENRHKEIYDLCDKINDERYFTNGVLKSNDEVYYIDESDNFIKLDSDIENWMIERIKQHYWERSYI